MNLETYNNDPELKALHVERTTHHRAADIDWAAAEAAAESVEGSATCKDMATVVIKLLQEN
ncbi:MAG: hypothetical protein JKY96_04570 [Phycisphaerales bacterium]|nr:hypothetical protein [Phycisphaerales bacterium]